MSKGSGHLSFIVVIHNTSDEIVLPNDRLHRPPPVDFVTKQGTYRFHSEFDGFRRILHRPDFGEVLLFDITDTLARFLNSRLGLGEIFEDHFGSLRDFVFLLIERGLDLKRGKTFLLSLFLIGYHLLQFSVGFGVGAFELPLLIGETGAKFRDLFDSVIELLETDVEMPLLFLQVVAFLDIKADIMIDEIKVVTRSQVCDRSLSLTDIVVDFVDRLVDEYHCVDDRFAMRWWERQIPVGDRNLGGRLIIVNF